MIERGLVVCDGTYAVAYLAHWQDSHRGSGCESDHRKSVKYLLLVGLESFTLEMRTCFPLNLFGLIQMTHWYQPMQIGWIQICSSILSSATGHSHPRGGGQGV